MSTCEICGEPLRLSWTACSNLAQCTICGSCYWYKDGEPTILALLPEYVELWREYWTATKQPMPSDYWNMFNGSYEVANLEQAKAFVDWLSERVPLEPDQEEAVTR